MGDDPRALLAKADKAFASSSGGFSLFGGRTEKLENAVDLYTQAANAYRLQKNGKEAGLLLEKAASIQEEKLNEPDDAALTRSEASKAYRKTDPEDAARCLDRAIKHYTSRGNFRRAASMQQTLAEIYEVDIQDGKRAGGAYEAAAGWFEEDNASALANKLYLKAADIAGLEGDYYKAIEHYERVAKNSINNDLMRFSVKDYLLKAGICHLATNDLVGAGRAVEGYPEMDPSFAGTREHQLLTELLEAVKDQDTEKYADKLWQFDQMSKLNSWKTTMLLRVKKNIQEEEDDFS
ncbi:vesicular-fusion protein sec17 [Eremomyces bilateralis CBS 781.70]|uniref:Vesicular-fusion protein sec17 n=1 Tax=Eremomyces bilateralis CBS 781.70 TaxID=1392243 RepID=A0A6G1FW78_9PEZI|nr:vesicular-fusion protein sec17 [Eremomyces bilateralis CBS 781.70]KAF1810033.1 vesicular-fusion protein sec17 [Eremomyces bilateralis CBS 781.70]